MRNQTPRREMDQRMIGRNSCRINPWKLLVQNAKRPSCQASKLSKTWNSQIGPKLWERSSDWGLWDLSFCSQVLLLSALLWLSDKSGLTRTHTHTQQHTQLSVVGGMWQHIRGGMLGDLPHQEKVKMWVGGWGWILIKSSFTLTHLQLLLILYLISSSCLLLPPPHPFHSIFPHSVHVLRHPGGRF